MMFEFFFLSFYFLFFAAYLFQLLIYQFPCGFSFLIKPSKVQINALNVLFQVESHFLFSVQGLFVLIYFLNELFFSLTRKVMDVTLYLLNSSCYFDFELSVLVFQLNYLRLKLGHLISALYLLVIELFNRPHLVQFFLNCLFFFL